MKTTTILKTFLLVMLLGSTLVSCASFPSAKQGDKTLLVIPIYNEYELENKVFGRFRLEISDFESDEPVKYVNIPWHDDHILVRNLNPGEYYISSSTFYYDAKYELAGRTEELDKYDTVFILRPGEISFTPMIFGQENFKPEGGRLLMARRFNLDLNGDYQEYVYNSLAEKFPEQINSWGITSFIGK